MQKYFSKYIIVPLFLSHYIFLIAFGDCPLSTVPSPPISSWSQNVDALIDEVKKISTAEAKCSKPAWYPKHLDVAIPARSIQQLLGYMQSVGYDVSSLISDIRYYFDNSWMLLPAEQEHQNSILDIQNKIFQAGAYVGSRCTQGNIFSTDIKLGTSTYKTKGRTLQAVLGDLSKQNTEVLKYYRNLIKNVQSREYIDELKFTIAPKGFAIEMQKFYSSDILQKCHNEDPKNQAILKVLKKAVSIGWKYPQAIQIWKDAFALLLYRSASLVGATDKDPSKEAEINSLVQAQKWGIGNSKFLLNSQFFKEFGRRANNQSIMETLKETGKRIAYETIWPIFERQVTNDVAKSSESPIYTKLTRYAENNEKARELYEVDRWNYDSYASRKIFVGQNKAQDPKTVTGLVQAMEELEKIRPIVEENVNIACNDVLNKQATNIPHPDCNDFANV